MSKNIVLAIHGLGGHSGWFARLKEELVPHGIDFYAYDLPGFGKNHIFAGGGENIKGHVNSFYEWVNFVENKYQKLKDENPGARITILGHSLGAVIATNLPKIYDGDKLILSVPGYKGGSTFNPLFLIEVVKKLIIDKFILGNDTYINMPVSKKAQDTPAMNDQLRVGTVTQTLLYQILQMGKLSKVNIQKITAPVLMIQIENDKVVDNPTQRQFFDMIPSEHKEFKTYAGADHDWIWYDIVKIIAADIAKFVQ